MRIKEYEPINEGILEGLKNQKILIYRHIGKQYDFTSQNLIVVATKTSITEYALNKILRHKNIYMRFDETTTKPKRYLYFIKAKEYNDIKAIRRLLNNYDIVKPTHTPNEIKGLVQELTQEQKEQRKIERLYKRIKSLIEPKNALFLTMTFNDDYLNSTTAKQREEYIKRFLRENTAEYIAYIDYGKTTQREHYHAIIRTTKKGFTNEDDNKTFKEFLNECKIDNQAYKKGFIDSRFILYSKKGLEQTIIDQIQHALKGNKGKRIIYGFIRQRAPIYMTFTKEEQAKINE